MNHPFRTRRNGDGVIWVEAAKDAAFRKALLDGIPAALRPKMAEALAAAPDNGAAPHAKRYFGAELPDIIAQIDPLLFQLNKYLAEQLKLPGLYDWLNVTGYGNDYRMIKAFKAWSEMKLPATTKPAAILNG